MASLKMGEHYAISPPLRKVRLVEIAPLYKRDARKYMLRISKMSAYPSVNLTKMFHVKHFGKI